tara:strand:+ start:1259 stop:2860 length:1602 start_codon:yes stop_codon:yes gene_type:complete
MLQVQSYLGNPNVKKDGVVQEWTPDLVEEYAKCMENPTYFAQKYCKIISLDKGLVPFTLYPYQQKMFKQFEDNRFNVVLACRQSGKSISACAYLLWFALFNSEKTVAILANKGATAREMLSRVTLMLENTPFFLQPGSKALNKGSLEFSNNSRILAAATSGSSIRGLSVNLLYLDEFAFVEKASEFYTSTYPVVSSGKNTKIIVTSTANGIGNTFYNIWQGAVQGVNEFKPFRVDWWDVPGRDDKWKDSTIANTSQLQFDQEFGNTFFGTGDTLINAQTLMEMRAKQPIEVMEGGDLLIYQKPKDKHDYIMCVDVAKGRGQDYSTFTLVDISVRPFRQVAVYRNNTISPILYPDIIYKWAKVYNMAYVVIESNDQGTIVCNGLYQDLEYENIHLESAVKSDRIGIEITRKTKRLGCSAAKDLLENNKLIVVDENTIFEASTFISKGQSYEASDGNHDDLMMNIVLFGYFVTGRYFGEMNDINMKEILFKQRMKEIENDIVPFGHIDDGTQFIHEEQNKRPEWHVEFDNYGPDF